MCRTSPEIQMETTLTATKRAVIGIIGLSCAASLFLIWLIYFKAPAEQSWAFISHLPAVNATLNGMSALCLVTGFTYIKKGYPSVHKRYMIAALCFSALFLVSYLTYHHFQGDTLFTGTGLIRPIYFFILITHIVLSIFALPMALITTFFSLSGRFDQHKRIARYTFPVWLYVSVTGVLVFAFLKLYS